MLGLPRIEWRGSLDYVPNRVISYLKAQRIVGKGCLSYLAFMRDIGANTPTIDSIPVVRDSSDVFLVDLPGMLPDRDIDFGIDLVPGTQTISIPMYRMTPAELKELKEQLQELLDKGFISPSVSSWGALILFVKTKDGTEGRVIVYASYQLKPYKKNYHVHDLELAAIIYALKIWRHYLYDVSCEAFANQFMRLDILEPIRVLACVVPQSSLYDCIREHQYDNPYLLVLKDTIQYGDAKEVTIGDDGVLRMQGRIYVPNVDGLCELILEEAHSSRYSIYSGTTKMYQDLRQHYWWRRMKKDIVEFVAWCLKC
ncbi:uncharacterized protein [Nicotiana sylvestris]|uniref:uncharacterized protein n=1 Tax=Nicotiana sylvestris TaxID=4096 RepID=UPI00388C89BA